MTKEFIFVGERPSQTAKERGWTWKDGHLAAKQLFEALVAMGIEPNEQEFINLFHDDGRVNRKSVRYLVETRLRVVGMGRLVQAGLEEEGIDHLKIVHPAARGKIRKKERYHAHIKGTLKS